MLALLRNRAYRQAITSRLSGADPMRSFPGGRTRQLLLKAMFTVMGRVAKMDGRVTRDEISYASAIMGIMGLTPADRRRAVHYYDQGKQPATEVLPRVRELAGAIGKKSALAHAFLKIQTRHAMVKGVLRPREKILLRDMAEILGFDQAVFPALCRPAYSRRRNFPHGAYRVLQLDPDVADGEIRRAYLRMMSRHHPDKLTGAGFSGESLRRAREKSLAIRSAYETVCDFRKIRP